MESEKSRHKKKIREHTKEAQLSQYTDRDSPDLQGAVRDVYNVE